MEMDSWNRFAHTGDIRDYLAYKSEVMEAGGTGVGHEQRKLHGDRDRVVCRTGRGI